MNCGICKGDMERKLVTHTEDLGESVVVIRNVPALVCSECGNVWYSGDVVQQLEAIVDAIAANPFTEVAVVKFEDKVA